MRRLLPLLLAACAARAEVPAPPPPVELVLHRPDGRPAPSTACDVRLCTSLLGLLRGAQTSIDFALYGMRGQPELLAALEAAKARGVRVRGVVDRTTDGKNYYRDTEALVAAIGDVHDDLAVDRRKAAAQREAFASRCWLPRPEGTTGPLSCSGFDLGDRCALLAQASREPMGFEGDIMHDKFFVVDGRYVWTGSTNASDSCAGGYNANLAVVIDAPEVAGWYTRELEQMFAGRMHDEKVTAGPMHAVLPGPITVDAGFSPQDRPMTRLVRPQLQAAKERIDVAIFFLTDKGVVADLIAAHRRGVAVRVLMDATGALNEYSKHEVVRAAGIPLKVEPWGGKMHMKAAAIDGRTVIAGSMNWTSAGEGGNDENTLILGSPALAAQFHAWFDATWASVPDRWLQGVPDPESRDSGAACTDGVDDDFDGLADAADPGCGPNPPALLLPAAPVIVPKVDGQPLVKAVVSREGGRTYWIPGQPGYDEAVVNPALGGGLFCSEGDARDAGYRRAR